MIITTMLRKNVRPDDLGLIPYFLLEADPRPAAEQFNERYAHGGGWRPQEGFTLLPSRALKYPGDSPMKPLAMIQFRKELIMIYPYGYVAIIQPDGSFEACRMD